MFLFYGVFWPLCETFRKNLVSIVDANGVFYLTEKIFNIFFKQLCILPLFVTDLLHAKDVQMNSPKAMKHRAPLNCPCFPSFPLNETESEIIANGYVVLSIHFLTFSVPATQRIHIERAPELLIVTVKRCVFKKLEIC